MNAKDSDMVAHNLSEDLFNLGYSDFDIEISSDPQEENTLESTDWHNIDEAPIQIVQIGPKGEYVNFDKGHRVIDPQETQENQYPRLQSTS